MAYTQFKEPANPTDGICEYINPTEPPTLMSLPWEERIITPLPGDPIDWHEHYGIYPFPDKDPGPNGYGPKGRIWKTNHFGNEDYFHCCTTLGSAYLGRIKHSNEVYVDISGGPFTGILKRDLLFTGHLIFVPFWNWKNDRFDRNNHYSFRILRPLWRYTRVPLLTDVHPTDEEISPS